MHTRTLLASAIFHFAEAILSPLAVVGYVLRVVRLLQYSRTSSASATVLAYFYTPWMQHRLGTRRDKPCDRLMRVLRTRRNWDCGS